MKTEKQIDLLARERGEKFTKMLENMDKIEINNAEEFFAKTTKQLPENQLLNFTPIVNEGVLIQQRTEMIGYLLFKVSEIPDMYGVADELADSRDATEENVHLIANKGISSKLEVPAIMIHVDSLQHVRPELYINSLNPYQKMLFEMTKTDYPERYAKLKKEFLDTPIRWAYSCDIFIVVDDDGDFEMMYTNFDSPELIIMKKQGRQIKDQSEFISERTRDFNGLMVTMAWLNHINENPEIKCVKQSNQPGIVEKRSYKPIAKMTAHRVILNGVKIVSENQKLISKLTSKKRQRFVETWTVRGHYRHYASGKVVYVKPYTKGKKGGQKTQKTYVAN